MNSKPKMMRYTLKQFQQQFPDNEACLEWLFRRFYPEGTVFCENCQKETKHHRVKSRPSYSCDFCGHHVHPTAGTIFHKSPTPLTTWFYATYLMAQTRCGISAKQIERETGVTYKTAWRMFNKIRSMLADEFGPIGGEGKHVEMDETGIGGVTKRTDRARKPKTTVFGMVERKGRVRAIVADDRRKETLMPIIREYVLPKTSVFTDDFSSYDDLGRCRAEFTHQRINHSAGVYVTGTITHTQTIEGFWSLIKRGIGGVYHSVSTKWLQAYLDEYSFRYSHRNDEIPLFLTFLDQINKQDVVIRRTLVEVEPF